MIFNIGRWKDSCRMKRQIDLMVTTFSCRSESIGKVVKPKGSCRASMANCLFWNVASFVKRIFRSLWFQRRASSPN